jgi:hypothetical protein
MGKVMFAAIDNLTATVFVLIVLFAMVKGHGFLGRGRPTLGADVSDDHGLLWTSAG